MDETNETTPATTPREVHHEAHHCKSCGGEILWCQAIDPNGQIVRREDGRPRAMPVNYRADPTGNVVVLDRGGTIVARVLRKGERPNIGEVLRTAHGMTCPHREDWRAVKRARKARGRT